MFIISSAWFSNILKVGVSIKGVEEIEYSIKYSLVVLLYTIIMLTITLLLLDSPVLVQLQALRSAVS